MADNIVPLKAPDVEPFCVLKAKPTPDGKELCDFEMIAQGIHLYVLLTMTQLKVKPVPGRPEVKDTIKFELKANVSDENIAMHEKMLASYAELVKRMKLERIQREGPQIIKPGDPRFRRPR